MGTREGLDFTVIVGSGISPSNERSTLPGVVIDTDVGTHAADRRYFIICDTDHELRGAYVAMNVLCCVLHDSVAYREEVS